MVGTVRLCVGVTAKVKRWGREAVREERCTPVVYHMGLQAISYSYIIILLLCLSVHEDSLLVCVHRSTTRPSVFSQGLRKS